MKEFRQSFPPFGSIRRETFLAGSGLFPLRLRTGIGCHFLHIGLKILTGIFEIGKQGMIIQQKDGVVPDVALPDLFHNTRPGLLMKLPVVVQLFRFYFYYLPESLHVQKD